MRGHLVTLGGCAALVLAAVLAGPQPAGVAQTRAATTQAAQWRPEAPVYGVSKPVTIPVTMDDGVVLSAQVIYPTISSTGAQAPGKFPVLLTQNPYGTAQSPVAAGDYYVQRGYIYVAASIRGTGASGGQVSWFGQRQGEDGAELVSWAGHHLAGSDGRVGLDGCSYLGVDQWFTAAAAGRNSALKVITPFCTDSDFYNDLTADGGIPTPFVAGIGQAEPRGPQDNPATDPQSVTIAQEASGGPRSYDNAYWQALDAEHLIPQIVANGIPALTEAGWQDLFPGGNLGDYVVAQNAFFHRPLNAPITAGEPVTGRYQAIVGPWTHGENVTGPVLDALKLKWFDTWLKGEPTGMTHTSAPLHIFENNASQWVDTAAWPPSPATQTYYLGDTSLTASRPAAQGSDSLAWTAASTATTLTYTTAPLARSEVLDGPSDVTIYATSSVPETEITATLNIVAPNGTVTKQADGVLLGSQRELDPLTSWYGTGHTLLQPSHPFTMASQQPVVPAQISRFDISLLANFTEIPAGYKIQLVLNSQPPANFHSVLAPTPQELANLAGGVYTIERSSRAASFIDLPLASPGQFKASPVDWGPSS
ncbi:MAG TPA: CocE/NonD family hydrolase [Streptosporangiaceae bacterium]